MTSETISSGEPGSFPWSVFHRRHPELVRQLLDALPYGPAERAAVASLLTESTSGAGLAPLPPEAADAERWRSWGAERWYGRPWAEVPFLWAESYFYRRLLEATGYFRPGAWQGIDPFGPVKAAELAGPEVTAELAALDELPALEPERRERALLRSALWGNRADLSFRLTAGADGGTDGGDGGTDSDGGTDGGGGTGREPLVDESALLRSALAVAPRPRVSYVADNAGRELLPDLVLIEHLLGSGVAEVLLHVKPYPYYVSDATTADVLAALDRLLRAGSAQAERIGGRLRAALSDGRLVLHTHPFFSAPLPFEELPTDLRAVFAAATVTIVKGDLNYRRLVGDRRWPPTTPFAARVAHFPGPVAALRTLKSEVVVGLDAATVNRLDATGEGWRTSGTYAVLQVAGVTGTAGTVRAAGAAGA
ncbi:damage-control phosphatase ARMT1 family protein [Kitasatospora sp. NBC_01287]|nr:damage-control phosphatase ARMT1 family protein [Kitasatospora sp. NBC_01287]